MCESAGRKPFVSVLEARLQPPYQGSFGIGSHSAPGLQRLQGATFTGEFPLAHVAFRDRRMPVGVVLDAFSPFIPHEEDDSGSAGRGAALHGDQQAVVAGKGLDRVLDREPDA